MTKLPLARSSSLVVQHLNQEVLIYDLENDQAYCLNETLANVYQACDGQTAFEHLKKRHKFTDDLIYLALDELAKRNLLAGEYQSKFAGMSRREVIKRVGFASMIALPVIAALAAPGAAHAASQAHTQTLGQACTSSTDCASSAPVCATSGVSQNTCCVGTNPSDRQPTDFEYAFGSAPGDCATFSCNSNLPISTARCCSGAATTTCSPNVSISGYVDYTCKCT